MKTTLKQGLFLGNMPPLTVLKPCLSALQFLRIPVVCHTLLDLQACEVSILLAFFPLLFLFSMHPGNSVMSNPQMVFNSESKNLSNLCIEHKSLELEI
jgi:hypothetical protein